MESPSAVGHLFCSPMAPGPALCNPLQCRGAAPIQRLQPGQAAACSWEMACSQQSTEAARSVTSGHLDWRIRLRRRSFSSTSKFQ